MKDKVLGVSLADGTMFPGGDLVIPGKGRVAVVDVGGHGGALSILRCWRYVATRPPEDTQEVSLFYIAITRPGHDPSPARLLWEFTANKAQELVKDILKFYLAKCTRVEMTHQEDIAARVLDACLVELREQSFLAAFEEWLTQEQSI